MEGLVTEVITKSANPDYDMMVDFQNGTLLKKKKGAKRKVEVTMDENTGLKDIKITGDEGQVYVGKEKPSEGYRTFVVVRKAGTGEIKMTEVGMASMMHVALSTTKEVAQTGTDYASRNSALQKMFGGKKGIRRMEKSEKFKINASTNEGSLSKTVNEMGVNEEPESFSKQLDNSLASTLPPCHRDVKNIGEVYLLSELLGQDVLDNMEETVIKSLTSKENLYSYTQALKNSISKMTNNAATALLMIDSLLHFINMKAPDLKRRNVVFSDHQVVHKKIIDEFCHKTAKSLTRSSSLRDKAVAYCMAIGFVIGGQVIPLDLLSQETGISYKKVSRLCRAVGGVPKDRKSHHYILKLPLPPLPTLSTSRRSST